MDLAQAMIEARRSHVWRTALLDPPWNERGGGKIKRGADRHYPLLKTPEMPSVIRGSGRWRPAESAHVYMWTTNNYLPGALWLLEQLGAKYKTNIVWPKTKAGLGQYFRGKHELLLFATIGRGFAVRTPRRDLTTLLPASTPTRHSEKPASAYELIEARSDGPYMEFFARSARPGWACWGNEVGRRE